jgi:regulator of protease activity HflC (stomatin/prohibitin superfamily)
MVHETRRDGVAGLPLFAVLTVLAVADLYWLVRSFLELVAWRTTPADAVWMQLAVSGVAALVLAAGFAGFFVVNPNEAKVLQLFGNYEGTARTPGLRWANPLYTRRPISLRVRNFETAKLKVNDQRGNPIEIASVVVWRVVDTAEAAFQVDDYENYVRVQSEAALRNLATGYAYDAYTGDEETLSGHTAEVSAQLKNEVQERLARAGVEVQETRISHLAYAPEIAATMLRRQQANAVVAARQRIVEGAIGMVDTALEMLEQRHVVQLDEERKAAMVSNLLVVLCSEQATSPVVNAGTLYP